MQWGGGAETMEYNSWCGGSSLTCSRGSGGMLPREILNFIFVDQFWCGHNNHNMGKRQYRIPQLFRTGGLKPPCSYAPAQCLPKIIRTSHQCEKNSFMCGRFTLFLSFLPFPVCVGCCLATKVCIGKLLQGQANDERGSWPTKYSYRTLQLGAFNHASHVPQYNVHGWVYVCVCMCVREWHAAELHMVTTTALVTNVQSLLVSLHT